MGPGIIVGIAFFSLAGYIARLAVRGVNGHDRQTESQRPRRDHRRRQEPPAASSRKTA